MHAVYGVASFTRPDSGVVMIRQHGEGRTDGDSGSAEADAI